MIFWKDDKGAICLVAHKTEDGGLVLMDGAHAIRLTREECYHLVSILVRHLFETKD